MREDELVSEHIYHIYNRGVEKRSLFIDDKDYSRFVDDLVIFNDNKPVINPKLRIKDIRGGGHKRKPLVDILAFCLMPNHYHLLLRQRLDGGITEFMRKLGGGYVNYFNLKHKRVGTLFQGKFKSVLINDEAQFMYIPFYIHLNPLDLIAKDWREKGISDSKKAINFLNNYKWSSHLDFFGKSIFPLVLHRDILKDIYGEPSKYKEDLIDFIKGADFSVKEEIKNSLIFE